MESWEGRRKFSEHRAAVGVLVVILFTAFAFQLWYHASASSPTIDEPTHILAGHMYWRCGDFGANPEHPPLVKLLATVSLNSRTLAEPEWECGTRVTNPAELFKAGAEFLINNGVDDIILPARLLSAILSLLFATVVFVTALKMFGIWEAVTSIALVAFEPNLIAHASLVTTDMALALTALGSMAALYAYTLRPGVSRAAIVGCAFGLMLASKHSALIFFPVLFVVFIADVILERPHVPSALNEIGRRTAVFAACSIVAVAILWSFYGFQYYALPTANAPSVDVAEYIRSNSRPEVAASYAAKAVVALDKVGFLPESYVIGLADVVAFETRNMFIFDRSYATGKWFYFPVAFFVKTSIALLLLLPLGIALTFFAADRRRQLLFLLVPPIFFFAFSMTSKINIGVRHLLPVYGFFIIAAAAGAVWMSRRFSYVRYVVLALVVVHALAAFRIAPNYIAFANDLSGGTDNLRKIFPGDSNLDWGQNEKFVAEYLRTNNVTECWYAGWGSLELMNALVPCRQMPNTFPRADVPLSDPIPTVIEGTVLVSAANLPPRGGNEYIPMTLQKPVTTIGGSIFVYNGRFEVKLASALSHAQRADELRRLGRFDEAIVDGRRAVELADYDPRTHLALARALQSAGNKPEAAIEFSMVLETARSNPGLYRNVDARARYELRQMAVDQGQE